MSCNGQRNACLLVNVLDLEFASGGKRQDQLKEKDGRHVRSRVSIQSLILFLSSLLIVLASVHQREPQFVLSSQILRSMCNVLVSKCSHREVTMVIVWLIPDVDAFVLSDLLCGCGEVLW